ncbi:tetratricopeptide repeat protein [Prevotella sp. HCN-7019]|uniref:tetratricopeptide repeat protein n=1 Tax=Prevotella sp. HCN-7019 TaxID=3134668 RepID=UPI0030C0A37F
MKKIILFEMIFIFCFGIAFPQTRNQKTKVVTKQNVQKEPDAKLLYDQACDFYNGTNGKFMDREKAISLYKQSADMGYSVAQYELGRLYVKSLIEKKDIIYITEEEALDYLKKSAKQNNPKALYALFTIYYEGLIVPQDYSIAIYWLRLGADLEDPACIFSLGLEYQIGKMVEIDDQKAFYLIKKAANLNYVDAYEMVGNCYLHGWGVEKNINEAKQWFRKGAEKDDSGCQAALADYYIELEDDYEQAYYWYRKSAEQGDSYAQLKTGAYYATGYKGCVEKDINEAIKWYRKSADQGNTDAQYRLAEYIKMDNPNEAFYWYKKAYEKGNLNAGAELGIMLFLGKGCVKDVKKSVEILQELSEKGVTRAIAVYGKMLIDGIPGILKKNKAKGNALLQSVQDINGNIRN